MNKNKIKNLKVNALIIIIEFVDFYYANIFITNKLNWEIIKENEYYDYEKYIKINQIIKYFKC